MIVVGLDTATWWGSVAVVADGEVRDARCERTRGSHAIDLLPLLERSLEAAATRLGDVDAFAVTRGPGSFTGLRVGLSTAKGLAYATGARLVAVPTLEALARSVRDYAGPVVVLLDARKGELYSARFDVDGAGGCRRVESDRLRTIDAVLGDLPSRCVIVGDADEAYGATIRAATGAGVEMRGVDAGEPCAVAVARLAEGRLARGADDEAMALEPEYIRPSEAELNWVSG